MTHWMDSFFYLAFAGQIFVLSSYLPRQIETRMRTLLDEYPPSRYPKLYPRPVEYYRLGIAIYRLVNRMFVVLGIAIIGLLLFVVDHSNFADDGHISEFWPLAFGMLQALPLIALEITEAGQFRLMRKANKSRQRAAVLERRKLFDFVSPRLFAAVAGLIAFVVLADLYVHDVELSWSHDTVQRTLWLIAVNLFFATLGAITLYGKKRNPHQSSEDRARFTAAQLQSMAYVSIAMSVFFLAQALDDVLAIGIIQAALVSVYFQAIFALSIGTILRQQPLAEIDFDVYRETGATAS
jgi:MFS family permease